MAFKHNSNLLRPLDNLNEPPTLELTQWAGFHNAHDIADIALVFFVMSNKLIAPLDELPVYRVAKLSLYRNGDGLIHLVARNHANALLSEISFFCHNCVRLLKPNVNFLLFPAPPGSDLGPACQFFC
jgi:hypothetical protein